MNTVEQIACQRFSTASELIPGSRELLSLRGQKILNVVDCAIEKCVYVLCLPQFKIRLKNKSNLLSCKIEENLQNFIDYLGVFKGKYFDCGPTNQAKEPTVADYNKVAVPTDADGCPDDDLASKAEEGAHVEDPDPGKLNAELEMMIKNFQYNTRLFLRAVRDSEEMKTILNELVQVSPMSVQSLGDLHLPLSVSRYEESVPQIILPEGLEKSKGKLMEYLLRFRRSIFADMLTTPEDKKRSKKYMREVLANLHEAQTKVNGLTKELNEIVSRNNEEVKRTTTKVQSLQGEIDNLKRYLEGRRQKINEEENAKRKEIEDENNEKMKKLEKQLADQKTDHQKLIESNQTEEHGERATIYKKESELESEIGKYDQEMTALQEEYDTLDEEYTREKKELNELEERFKTLEEEYLKIMEERRLNEERRQREEEERRLLEKAVTTIQAFWRSYKTRKLIRGGRRGGSRKKK